ncbi:MAG: hypothetical protein Kow0079_14040 [Vicingaceae bacterium]
MMKFLKYLLIGIVIIIVSILVIAGFMDTTYAVKRSITINRPKSEVFEYVKYLKNQENYSVWAQMDPNMKRTFTGTDGTVGFISAWESENEDVGKGEQEITGIKEGALIDYELRFYEPFETKDHAYISFEKVENNQTKLVWGFDGKMSYPMNIMLLFMDMDGMLGKDLQQGLDNLKVLMEK